MRVNYEIWPPKKNKVKKDEPEKMILPVLTVLRENQKGPKDSEERN